MGFALLLLYAIYFATRNVSNRASSSCVTLPLASRFICVFATDHDLWIQEEMHI
jgi:hypothetical protein